jgi:hypothetical protein
MAFRGISFLRLCDDRFSFLLSYSVILDNFEAVGTHHLTILGPGHH